MSPSGISFRYIASVEKRPVAAIPLHQPAVELRQRALLPRVTASGAETGAEASLDHRVRPDVLHVEVVHARLGRGEQLLEKGDLQRFGVEAVADVDGDRLRALGPD